MGALAGSPGMGSRICIRTWQSARLLPGHDPYFLPLAAILTGWGLLTIAGLFPDFGYKQMTWMVVAVGLTALGLLLPHNLGFLRRYK